MKNFLVYFITFLVSINTPVFSERKDFFRCYYDKLVLPQSTILHISQDTYGFLWLSTQNGVFRFDGNNIISLSDITPSYNELLQGPVFWSIESPSNDIWFSNATSYSPQDGAMTTLDILKDVSSTAPVKDKDGNLWILFNDRIERLTNNDNINYKLDISNGSGLTLSEYYIWCINKDNIYRLTNEESPKLKKYDIKEKGIGHAVKIISINDNELLIGTNDSGLWLFNCSDLTCENILEEKNIRDIISKSSNEYWIATNNGIYKYFINDKSFIHLKKDAHNIYAIQDNSIYSFFKDRENGIWVGSFFRGLSYVPNQPCVFNSYRPSKAYPGLEGTVIGEFAKDKNGNLWIATEDHGLNCYSPKNNSYTNYEKGNNSIGFNLTSIHSITIIDNCLWCGSFDEGIEVIDLDKMRVIKKYSKDDGKSNLSSNLISSLLLSSHGDILVGSDNGVQLYDSKSDSFVTFNSELNGALQLFEDSKQNLWVVNNYDISVLTPNKNLSRYNFTNKKVLSITEDKDNIIWIATSKGIEYFDKEKREFIPNNFTSNDKATNFTYRIEEDEDGFFWISTGNGLVCFHPHKKTQHIYTIQEGLPENRFNANSSFKDDNGDIYMGTINGFTSFNPQFPKDASILPSLIITKLTCMGKNGGRDIYFSSYKKIKEEINYNENSITIEFSSLTYSAPNTLKYKYRLDPLDKSWHELEGTTTINYNSLPYGEYNLKIKSTDYYGNWLDNEINHSIEILPPFYATLLAKILYGLVLLIIIIQIIRHYQKRVVNKQKRAIDELKSKTEKELYLTKINFFTTIVHEIRTPLTLIKIPLEKEMETNNNDNLLLIEKNVDRLTKLCSQLLDFRKVESNQLQLNFVKTDIPDFISNIIFRFMPLIKSKEIQFTHNLQDVNLIAPIDREAFTKIVSNLLNNSIKYADSIIQLNVSKKDKVFELSIKNDGAKIIGEDRKQIFNMFFRANTAEKKIGNGIGLSFCRSLAEMHKGTLDLKDGDFTNFVLTLPLYQKMTFKEEYLTDKEGSQDVEVITSDSKMAKSILIVEDEKELRDLMKKELSAYNVYSVTNGIQALSVLRENVVDMVITDVMMPKMDGLELCKEIKNKLEWCDIPVIMLTAKNSVDAKLEGFMAGADEYIDKPFSFRFLKARMVNIWDKNRIWAERHLKGETEVKININLNNIDRQLVENFKRIVDNNLFNSELSITFLCKELNISQSSFFRKIKQLMNVTPNDYIRIARLEKAAKLILETENPRISEIAYELGFSSPSYFSLCFTRHYGMPPKDYIKSKKGSVNELNEVE